MVERKLVLRGSGVGVRGVDPLALGAVLTRLEKSLHGAVDVAFIGSCGNGRRSDWLRRAGQVELRDAQRTGDEEMALYFDAALFGEVAAPYFQQPTLFASVGPKPTETAFDALAGAVVDVAAGRPDSERFDPRLLRRFLHFGDRVVRDRVRELDLCPDGASCGARINEGLAHQAARLYKQTPRPARVRVAGRLDMVQASTLAFLLLLDSGEHIRGVWQGKDFETLRALVNTDVAVSGLAIYRPSGSLLRLDADVLSPQTTADKLFKSVPAPRDGKLDIRALLREQKKRGGFAALIGQVPAEESDEEFLAAVAEMD